MKMRDCLNGTVRDLLPEFVRGTLSAGDSGRVEAHVRACVDCAAEAELLRAVIEAHPLPAVDISRIAAAIPAPGRVPSFRAARWRAAAAVVVVVLGGAWIALAGGGSRQGGASLRTRESAEGGPNDSALSAVLLVDGARSRAEPTASAAETGFGFGGGLSDLTEEQLTTLLGEVETLDASLSAEPDVHVISSVTALEEETNDW